MRRADCAAAAGAILPRSSAGRPTATVSAPASWPSCRNVLRPSRRPGPAPRALRMIAVRRRLLWALLIGITLAIIVLIANRDGETIVGLPVNDFGSLIYQLAFLIFIGGAVLVLFRERFSQALEAALFWVVVGFVLVFAYTYRAELRQVGDRIMSEMMPGRA